MPSWCLSVEVIAIYREARNPSDGDQFAQLLLSLYEFLQRLAS